MKRSPGGRRAALLLLASWVVFLTQCGPQLSPELRDVLPVGGDFVLQGDQGNPVALAAYPNKVKLVFFGFTTCPMACPATLLRLQQAFRLLEPDIAAQAMVVFVSVDPERDTPDSATRYLQSFGLPGIGVTGNDAELAPVVKAYAGFYRKTEDPTNPIEHGLTVYLLDPQHQTRRLISSADSPEQIANWIKALVQAHGAA